MKHPSTLLKAMMQRKDIHKWLMNRMGYCIFSYICTYRVLHSVVMTLKPEFPIRILVSSSGTSLLFYRMVVVEAKTHSLVFLIKQIQARLSRMNLKKQTAVIVKKRPKRTWCTLRPFDFQRAFLSCLGGYSAMMSLRVATTYCMSSSVRSGNMGSERICP